jgi:adenosine deaminase
MPDFDETLTETIARMPKAELHRHLEGSLTPEMLLEARRRFAIPLPAQTPEELAPLIQLLKPLSSLHQVLQCFHVFAAVFTTPEVVRFLAERVVEEAARDGIRYLELRFSPGYMAFTHGLDPQAVSEAVIAGAGGAAARTGTVLALIAIASREMGPEVCLGTVRLAAGLRPHIAGVDLAGEEEGHAPQQFVRAFDLAREHGLGITIHAGEQAFPENVRAAVELLHAGRIGHGIQIVGDEALMGLLRERRIPLEISITSNVIVGAVRSPADHPVCKLMAAGVPVTLNSDDPGLFALTLSSELGLFARLSGCGLGELVRLQLCALEHGFAPEVARGVVREELHRFWSRA